MPSCSVCGSNVQDTDIVYSGGIALCRNCESTGAYSQDSPCARCGVYIPRTEMQMYKSRLYCSYCIMDIRHEEKDAEDARGRKEAGNEGAGNGESNVGAASSGGKDGGKGPASQEIRDFPCEICGRESGIMYYFGTIRVCPTCKEGLDPDIYKITKKPFGNRIPVISQIISKIRGKPRKFNLKEGIGKMALVEIIRWNRDKKDARDWEKKEEKNSGAVKK